MGWHGMVTVTLDKCRTNTKLVFWEKLLHPLLSPIWYQLGSVPSWKGEL